jgi:hypothetical protein
MSGSPCTIRLFGCDAHRNASSAPRRARDVGGAASERRKHAMSTYAPTHSPAHTPAHETEPSLSRRDTRHDRRAPTAHRDVDTPAANANAGRRQALRFVIAAASVSAACLVVLTALDTPVATGEARHASPGARRVDLRLDHGIDHGVIAADAPSTVDAQTVEASIAAYER